jgi:hypothetical protein
MKLPDGTAKGNWGLPWAAKAQRPRPIAYGVVSAGHLDKGRVACVVRRLLGLRTLYTLYMLTMSWYRPGWHYANGPPRSSIIIHQHTMVGWVSKTLHAMYLGATCADLVHALAAVEWAAPSDQYSTRGVLFTPATIVQTTYILGVNSIVLMPFTAAGIMYTALANESGITCTLVSTNGKFVLLFVA